MVVQCARPSQRHVRYGQVPEGGVHAVVRDVRLRLVGRLRFIFHFRVPDRRAAALPLGAVRQPREDQPAGRARPPGAQRGRPRREGAAPRVVGSDGAREGPLARCRALPLRDVHAGVLVSIFYFGGSVADFDRESVINVLLGCKLQVVRRVQHVCAAARDERARLLRGEARARRVRDRHRDDLDRRPPRG